MAEDLEVLDPYDGPAYDPADDPEWWTQEQWDEAAREGVEADPES